MKSWWMAGLMYKPASARAAATECHLLTVLMMFMAAGTKTRFESHLASCVYICCHMERLNIFGVCICVWVRNDLISTNDLIIWTFDGWYIFIYNCMLLNPVKYNYLDTVFSEIWGIPVLNISIFCYFILFALHFGGNFCTFPRLHLLDYFMLYASSEPKMYINLYK